jgi:hypothetical protein
VSTKNILPHSLLILKSLVFKVLLRPSSQHLSLQWVFRLLRMKTFTD